ncbi:MAG: hypothetical protein HQ582_08140 [Planctomycetes bacterium]|nr:hypothetical protein [Planctomycetota bacterium]
MDTDTFQQRLKLLAGAIGPDVQHYRDSDFWDSAGTTRLDEEFALLADLYLESSTTQQESIRAAVAPKAEWNLVAYVRRLSIILFAEPDPTWIRRGLAIACIENGRFDFRDLIVSLVILRSAAEQMHVDPLPYFGDALLHCDEPVVHIIEDARDHREKDVRDILREFGPPALKPKRRKKTS